MRPAGQADRAPAQVADWRRERREVARRLHPDLGGSTEDYLAALADVDRRFGLDTEVATASSGLTLVLRRARRYRRRVRGAARRPRGRLPRGVPGARRYIDLTDRTAPRPESAPPIP